MIQKGDNLRILLIPDGVAASLQVVAKATNCTLNLQTNTEDAAHKDIVGMFGQPVVVSKNWSISVESLDVTDAATLLNAIKAGTKFKVLFSATATTNNQTPVVTSYMRQGLAYINDITFNWNDRELSTKSIQLTGASPLEAVETAPQTVEIPVNNTFTRGQFVRLFISSNNTDTPNRVIGAARQLSLHVSTSLETATTKDTDGDWQIQEPTAVNFDITSSALVNADETITSEVEGADLGNLMSYYEAGLPVKFEIANVSGANQRTKGTVLVSGSVIIAQLQVNGPTRQNADYTTTLNGFGPFVVGA